MHTKTMLLFKSRCWVQFLNFLQLSFYFKSLFYWIEKKRNWYWALDAVKFRNSSMCQIASLRLFLYWKLGKIRDRIVSLSIVFEIQFTIARFFWKEECCEMPFVILLNFFGECTSFESEEMKRRIWRNDAFYNSDFL